jgi:predicted RNase H-like nuclease (RuvC/YqgF family)
MEFEIQDLKQKLIEKENEINELKSKLQIYVDRYEKNKKISKKKIL